jgi:small redox-active disulfide protein 2
MEIKVFGPGCARCNETEQLVKDVLAAGGVAATVMKVSDLKEMMMAGIMSTPAVAVDGVVKSTGKVPSKEEISAWIAGAAAPAQQGGGCCCAGKC